MNRNTIVSLCYGCAALNSFSFLKYAFGFYRRSIAYGWAFDLTFGSECFINLISDYLLLATYKDFPLPSLLLGKESLVLLGFIAWNSAGISICYISSIVLAVHFANTVDLKEAMQDLKDQNVEEGDFRRQMMITTISVFTLMAFMKGAILYNMYMYYKKTDGVDGSIEEAPTAYYFPADPTAPVPFLPPESKRHTRANVGGAPPAAARCGLTGHPTQRWHLPGDRRRLLRCYRRSGGPRCSSPSKWPYYERLSWCFTCRPQNCRLDRSLQHSNSHRRPQCRRQLARFAAWNRSRNRRKCVAGEQK
ncbi:uncharacterized protein LOC119445191 isoform X1 [Dermacentor silvarum]|uniref:uncharacterized protein LOC119445191 isoform X1 n=1 Tax=Dermacentor silvarum TaxID=543639 RepID=UPI002101AAF0|nr:uncharacterized protein LOC119445191 isoform X1 [Dermacentor silvarum]